MSFARTKILPPRPRSGLLLPRPALERALVDALGAARGVLVCAAAGYGKTALLGRAVEQFVAARPGGHAAAWISLDEGDDLGRVLDCIVAALEPFDPPWRTAPEGLVAEATRPGGAPADVADELVNTLDACEVAHGVIVLDDLHHVTDAACTAFLDRCLQRMSPRWTVAVAARHEPGLRLARLRAAGELVDFGEAQLRFGRDEVRALVAGAGLDDAAADALHARSAGWAAGLRLALSGAAGGGAIDRPAFDFLTSEVLARIASPLRDFLVQTSVLHDLDPIRCAAVMLQPDAEAARQLHEIERLGLFATVVDERGPVLHLHDLFRDALQHVLRRERPQDWPVMLARAAGIESDPVRRQALLLSAGRKEEAARALLAAGPQLITHGGLRTLMMLLDQFPPAFCEGSAELQRVLGSARWTLWDARSAERHLAAADALFTARGAQAEAGVARAHHAITLIGLGRLADAGRAIDRLAEAPLDLEGRIAALQARTWHALETGHMAAVAPLFAELVDALEAAPRVTVWFFTVPPPRQVTCPGVLKVLPRWAAGALEVGGDRNWDLRALGALSYGWVALWQGRLGDAETWLARAAADAQWTGHQVVLRSHMQAARALLHALQGDGEAAAAEVRTRIAEHPTNYGDWGLWHLLFFGCRVASASDDVAALQAGLARARALQSSLPEADAKRLWPMMGMQGTLAWLQGRRDEAVARWRAALTREEHLDLLGQAADVRVRLAWALAGRGAWADAADTLQPVLASPDVDPIGALLARTALRGLAQADWSGAGAAQLAPWQVSLLRRWSEPGVAPAADDGVAAPAPSGAAPTVSDSAGDVGAADGPLSAREWEVLAQIADGASNKLIARALDLSPHTVKRHVANILDKLALASRGQAAAWYRQSGRAT